jgi:DNA polymerase-3 subunit epsilon
MRQLILDTETTGLDPKQGHRIIEFAALEMVNRQLTGSSLHLYINPEREIELGASQIHGIYDKDVKDKPNFAQVVQQIVDYISGSELIIHNAKFDVGFLDFQFSSLGFSKTNDYVENIVDTLTMARRKYPGGKNNLDSLCDRFKVDRSNRDYHGALIDCKLLSEVYLNLTREQISLNGLEKQIINPKHFKFEQITATDNNLKLAKATPEEKLAHQQIIEQINAATGNKALWNNSGDE